MRRNMFRTVICITVFIILTGSVFAECTCCKYNEPFPKTDKNGDYILPFSHIYWEVADKDPNGLNGRLSKDFPVNWNDARTKWPNSNVAKWPVVARFGYGKVLNAVNGNRGINRMLDANGKPWLMIEISKGKYCFVRANKKYIVPVRMKNNESLNVSGPLLINVQKK